MTAAPPTETAARPVREAKNAVAAVNPAPPGGGTPQTAPTNPPPKYKDDLLVCVNGESCLIQRGVTVQVKRKFLWAIQNQMRQDASTANLIQTMSSDYVESAKAHNA